MKKLLLAAILALFGASAFAADVTGKVEFLTKRGQKPVPEETIVWLEPIEVAKAARLEPGSTSWPRATRRSSLM
jgi:hypothetical protein